MGVAVLTLNAGSSSIKFALFEIDERREPSLVFVGKAEENGAASRFIAKDPDGVLLADQAWPDPVHDFPASIAKIVDWVEPHLGAETLAGVGHRVVHGGPSHISPERVTPALLAQLDQLVPLAPLHEPHNIAAMRAIGKIRPNLPQIACFDTAFHHSMPAVATRFALPRVYEAEGVRRYGFHGLSYEYVADRLRSIAPGLACGKVIAAHLGNGASLCAMASGQSVDTTMGFTALDGLVMGTRCGNIDPGVILYLEQQKGLKPSDIEDLLYHRSGLLGVSGGLASDMRTLLKSTDERAKEAIELFVFRIAREIGALTSSLGGLDGIVFTAGIGENAAAIRAGVCARLAWLGVVLDPWANIGNEPIISAPQSKIEVRVIPTDEEKMIACHTITMIAG